MALDFKADLGDYELRLVTNKSYGRVAREYFDSDAAVAFIYLVSDGFYAYNAAKPTIVICITRLAEEPTVESWIKGFTKVYTHEHLHPSPVELECWRRVFEDVPHLLEDVACYLSPLPLYVLKGPFALAQLHERDEVPVVHLDAAIRQFLDHRRPPLSQLYGRININSGAMEVY